MGGSGCGLWSRGHSGERDASEHVTELPARSSWANQGRGQRLPSKTFFSSNERQAGVYLGSSLHAHTGRVLVVPALFPSGFQSAVTQGTPCMKAK